MCRLEILFWCVALIGAVLVSGTMATQTVARVQGGSVKCYLCQKSPDGDDPCTCEADKDQLVSMLIEGDMALSELVQGYGADKWKRSARFLHYWGVDDVKSRTLFIMYQSDNSGVSITLVLNKPVWVNGRMLRGDELLGVKLDPDHEPVVKQHEWIKTTPVPEITL